MSEVINGVVERMQRTTNAFNHYYEKVIAAGDGVIVMMPVVSPNARGVNDIGYPEIVSAIMSRENGTYKLWFDKEGATPHDLYIYYRWIPTDKSLDNRLLVMIGVSKYSVNTNIGAWITYGALALIIISAIFIIGAVILLCQLGYIYNNREGGGKWRSKTSS